MLDSTQNINVKKLFHFEDTQVSEVSESIVGRKGLSLFKLYHFDSPVPDFFILSPILFFKFATRVFREKRKEIESMKESLESRDIVSMFSRFDFDDDIVSEIVKNYTKLSGFTDAWVSVRSSVSFPKRPEVSFSGVFNTQLNVRGIDNLLKSIKQVYASAFSDSVVRYCVNEGIDLSEVGLAIVVQKMVQPEVSGVAFTTDPITQDDSRMSVEAVYGLGDVISNGDITPDSYTLLKKDLAIVEKHIAPQDWMRVRTLKGGGVNTSEKIQISPSWSHRQKLEDRYILEVSKVALMLEEKMEESLDIEWVLSGGRLWILQAKSTFAKQSIVNNFQVGFASFVPDSLYKVVKEIISSFEDSETLEKRVVEDAGRMVEKENPRVNSVNSVGKDKEVQNSGKVSKAIDSKKVSKNGDQFILSGIGSSFGTVEGTVKVYSGKEMAVTNSDILVMKKYENSSYEMVKNAGGLIVEVGGLTSDISILCRELNKPAIVGASVATSKLKSGDIVRIDGNSGSVYLVDSVKAQEQVVAQEIASKLSEMNIADSTPDPVSTEVVKGNVVREVTYQRDSNLAHSATKVYLSSGKLDEVVNSDGVVFISLDHLMLEDGRHPLDYVANKKYKEYAQSIAKKIDEIASICSPNEVVVSIGQGSVSKFRKLVKGKEYEGTDLPERGMGALRYINSPKLLDLSLKIIKRVRNVLQNRNVSIGIHSPINGVSMREIKKSVSASGLRRTSTFNVYAIIENPSEIIVLDDIVNADIDGIILNTPAVAKQMQGTPYEDSVAKIDLGVGSVFTVVDSVVNVARKTRLRLTVVTGSSNDLIKHCVSKGVYGVVVDDGIVESKKYVSEQETKILMSAR